MVRNILLTAVLLASITITSYAQCVVTAYANAGTNTVEVCLGDAVTLTSVGTCPNYVLFNDFNDGTPGTGWSATNQAMFTNPCAPHSPDGTIYLWMGSTSTAPRNLTTVNFDVSQGGSIEFEMRYAVQSTASPCEGPDLYNEGIALQYSTNNGGTWNTIEYYAPNGNILNYIPTATSPSITGQTPFTVWTTQVVAIPTAAQTTSTRFRWAQTISTSEVYDHWGLDNVKILVPPPTITYWWAHGPTVQNPPDVFPTTNTTYTVFMSDGSDTVQSSVNVIVHPIPTSDFTVQSPVCVGNPSTITYTGTATSSATYAWGFDGGTIISGSGQGPYQVSWGSDGIYNVTLGIMENGCLSLPNSIAVTVNPNPTPPNITFTPTCVGDNLQLSADYVAGVTYSWVGPNGFTSNLQEPVVSAVTQANAGNYSVFITDGNGCVSALESENVTILNLPVVSFSGSPLSGCAPLTVNFNNTTSSTASYFWQFGDSGVDTISNPSHIYQNSGSYNVTLTVTDNNGCSNQLTNNNMITVHPSPVADFTTNPDIGLPNSPVTFNSTYNVSLGTWYWEFGDGTPNEIQQVATTQHTYTNMGTYTITHIVESQFGCKDTITKTFLVLQITIPNVFTPNGDGINDYFVIDGLEQLSGNQLIVFNRWGKKVFESTDYKNDWDGNGASDGVYYFILTFKEAYEREAVNGTVTILR